MLFADRMLVPAMKGRGRMACPAIYRAVRAHAHKDRLRLSKSWQSTIRNTLQRHCKQNPKFNGDYRFIHRGRGVWECRA